MGSLRRPHTKSKHGCIRCRLRRVKCDEKVPCSNCVRHEIECSLLHPPSPQPTKGEAQTAPGTHPSESSTQSNQQTRANVAIKRLPPRRLCRLLPASSSKLQDQALRDRVRNLVNEATALEKELKKAETITLPRTSALIPSASWTQDLQLFSHYHDFTYESFSKDDSLHETWRHTVPRLAFANAPLMHGLLAVTALHLAHVKVDKRSALSIVAARHQSKALSSFTSQAQDVTTDNYPAYIILASFIFIADVYMIVDSHRRGHLITVNDVVQSFRLIRGVKGIVSHPITSSAAKSGPLSDLLKPQDLAVNHPDDFQLRIEQLAAHIRNVPVGSKVQEVCLSALAALRLTLATVTAPGARTAQVWRWPGHLDPLYLGLLEECKPIALVILAHFAALVGRCENKQWYSQGWSEGVVAVVQRSVDQDEWRGWLKWPMSHCKSE